MRRGATAAVLAALALAFVPAAAQSEPEDLPFVNWARLLPALATGFTPDAFDVCRDGAPTCVQATLTEMRRRLAILDETCDHNALFARNYLTVTEHYAQLPPGFFDDDRWLAHEDAVFGKLYFDAYDNWKAGRRSQVPVAWRIAFDSARDRSVQGAGDLMLGINAHVQRDMPFMLAGLGLRRADGLSRKPDHDRFNGPLSASYEDVYGRGTVVDDPGMAFYNPPGKLDAFALFQVIALWREGVWRNAERLVRARTPAQRRSVAQSIENQATLTARIIKAQFPNRRPFVRDPEARDRGCRARQAHDPGPGTVSDSPRDTLIAVEGIVVRLP